MSKYWDVAKTLVDRHRWRGMDVFDAAEGAYGAGYGAGEEERDLLRALVRELADAIDGLDLPDGNYWSDYAHWPGLLQRARAAVSDAE